MLSLLQTPKAAARAVLALAALVLAACSDASTSPDAAAPRASQPQANAALASFSASTNSGLSPYLVCPSTQTVSASKVIGPRGGILAVNGSAIAIPPGAVPHPTRFTFTIPASDIMQIEVHADGVEHYFFNRRVVITIDYSRCASAVDQRGSLSAWYIDTPTQSPLSWMGGVDDRLGYRLFFSTDHLSGYAVSERRGAATDSDM
jgi:hypothetical protein